MRRFWMAGIALGTAVAGMLALRQRRKLTFLPAESLILQRELLDQSHHGKSRLLRLENAVNLRDLGGYPARDGKRIKWGMLYRSGSLGKLTDHDLKYLEALDIRLVCDLRHTRETLSEPDRIPVGAVYWHSPLDTDDRTRSNRRLRALIWNPKQLGDLMLETYTDVMLDGNAKMFGEVLRRLSNPENLPALFHCTAGKDRTGIAAMLLMLALGVPEEVIVADYTLSNLYYRDYLDYARKAVERYKWLGVNPDNMYPLLVADARTIQHALDHLRKKYGNINAYLRDAAGVDEQTQERLCALLLEPA
jgi:protein-tyrosine phosphatase